jgi:hypothetical protein
MAELRAHMAGKQAAHRSGLRGSRLLVVTLQATGGQQARGVTPALSDTFVPVEIDRTIPANRMLRVCVSNAQGNGIALAASLISS